MTVPQSAASPTKGACRLIVAIPVALALLGGSVTARAEVIAESSGTEAGSGVPAAPVPVDTVPTTTAPDVNVGVAPLPLSPSPLR